MDVTEFDVPLFSPNIAEINFDIFGLWLEGYNEKDVIQYLTENVLYSKKSKDEEDKNEKDMEFHMRRVIEQIRSGKLYKGRSGTKKEGKGEKVDKWVYEKKDSVLVKTEVKGENTSQGNNKNKFTYFEKFASENYSTKDKDKGYVGKAKLRMKKKCSDLIYTYDNSLHSSSSTMLFYYFLLLYIKHQFYIYNILSHHLGSLDLRFSHLIVPLNKNVKQKLVKIYYSIDINFEKEIIKYKNINNITKNVHTLIRVTNIHEISIRRQIENIKNLWRYILNIYESKHINISKLYKHNAISFKRIVKSIKTRFHLYKHFIKREKVLDASDNAGGSQSSMQTKEKKKKKKKKRNCTNDSDTITTENNIIKLLETLIGMSLAKRYFRLYWIIVYHIETPKKIPVPYHYFNKIILILLDKLQINDLILSKEYISMSKKIYTIMNNAECMEKLKTDLFSITENDAIIRNRRFMRVRSIMNLLCCFQNTYEIKKLFLIFIDMHKTDAFENEQEFVKKHLGNSRLVNRVLSFIKEAENYTVKSGILNLTVHGSVKNM